jgi:hypothetical protein
MREIYQHAPDGPREGHTPTAGESALHESPSSHRRRRPLLADNPSARVKQPVDTHAGCRRDGRVGGCAGGRSRRDRQALWATGEVVRVGDALVRAVLAVMPFELAQGVQQVTLVQIRVRSGSSWRQVCTHQVAELSVAVTDHVLGSATGVLQVHHQVPPAVQRAPSAPRTRSPGAASAAPQRSPRETRPSNIACTWRSRSRIRNRNGLPRPDPASLQRPLSLQQSRTQPILWQVLS